MGIVHVELVFAIGWAAFWLGWLSAALTMKRGRTNWNCGVRVRVLMVIVVFILLRLKALRNQGVNSDPRRAGVGLVLFTTGLA